MAIPVPKTILLFALFWNLGRAIPVKPSIGSINASTTDAVGVIGTPINPSSIGNFDNVTPKIIVSSTLANIKVENATGVEVSSTTEGHAKKMDDGHQYEELPVPLSQKDGVKGYTRSDGTYIIEDTSGTPCVLAYFKAKITVYFPVDRKNEKYKSTVVSPPDDAEISGSCDRDSLIAVLDITWDQGVFSLRFAFDDLTDSWYVSQFSFKFDTKASAYKGVDQEQKVLLRSEDKRRFWATSHARSFRCLLLHDVSLQDENDLYSATIHFDEARVQALTKTDNFKTPKHCIHRVHRDEMVPIFVGGSLAAITLLTVTGYAAFRYFKVKKFQYGTME